MTPPLPPLEDLRYEPAYRPVNGRPPELIARWGAASQLRWFRRFMNELAPEVPLAPFYCHSAEHRGPCCDSCVSEWEDGHAYADACCCRAVDTAASACYDSRSTQPASS